MSTEQENNKVTLYIATHNATGKKYFGKTKRYFTEEDLQKYYHGSGKYWNNHLKEHGDDVTMEIYGIYNIDEVKEVAIKFSEENNIAEDYDNWANMIPENGLDGGCNIIYNDEYFEKCRKDIICGKNFFERRAKKAMKTMGLIGIKKKSEKSINTMRNDVDENGLNGLQRRGKTLSRNHKYRVKQGINNMSTSAKLANIKQKNDVDENGLNGLQRRAINRVKNSKDKINENGLNVLQNTGLKMAETKRQKINENGENLFVLGAKKAAINMRKTIMENGLTIEENRTLKLKNTLREKSIKKYGVFDVYKNNKIFKIDLTLKELKEISQVLMKKSFENQIKLNGDFYYSINKKA